MPTELSVSAPPDPPGELPPVDPVPPGSRGQRLALGAVRSSAFWILFVLLVEVVTFSLALPPDTFISTFNAQTIASDASVLLILAAGATFVIISGGLDLSIGSVMTLAAVVAALVMNDVGGSEATAIIAGVAAGVGVGMAWGCLNGLLVAVAKVPPFVVTLGSLGAALGVARLLSEGKTVGGTPPTLSRDIGQGVVFSVPVPFLIGAAAMLVFGIVLHQTRFGEHTYLIGSNEEAARRGGIHVKRHVIAIYAISGALAGLAGLVDLARFDSANVATGHVSELLAAIAAVVIGGASLFGGVGVMAATAVGVFIPVVLSNGLLIGGIERFWQDIIIGAFLVTAVAFDQWRRGQELKGR
ncbi:MAG TPA: ABC transporter permease [Solirubrobacterales bacterium]|nr:ABC transporter permease [Solirubrobacterales bacterium]